jgi:hypothetical protein
LHSQLCWESFTQLAEDHGTLGFAASRLLNEHENLLPLDAAESIRAWRRGLALFTLNLTAEMFRLLDGFRVAGIETLVVKGPVLSLRCYGDAGLRQYGDLDLIVRDRDVLRTTQLMLELGYDAKVPPAAIRARKIPGEYVFRHARSNLRVEFHTELTFRYHPRPIPLDTLLRRQTQVTFDGRAVPALSLEDELVLICVHGAKHFWERLIYVADVAALISRQQLDWNLAITAAREVGATRMLHAALQLAADILNVPPPEQVARLVQCDAVAKRLATQISRWLPAAGSAPPNIFARALFRMRMRGSAFRGLPYLLRLSLSPTEEDWADSGASERHWFLDALGRPFRLARKYGRDGKS